MNNVILEPNIIKLFTDQFDSIKNKFNDDIYNWNKLESILNDFYKILSDPNINENNFIKSIFCAVVNFSSIFLWRKS